MISLTVILAVFSALVALARWRPLVAVSLLIVGLPAYLFRGSVVGIPITVLEAGIIGALVGWAIKIMLERRTNHEAVTKQVAVFRQAAPRLLMIFMAMLILGWILATAFSVSIRESLGALKAWLIEPLLLSFMLMSEMRSSADRRTIVRSLLIGLTLVSVAGFVQLQWWPQTVEDGRLSSFFAPVANYFAMFAAPIIVLAAGFALIGVDRWPATAAFLIGTTALILSHSYGGIVAVVIGLAVLAVRLFAPRVQREFVAILLLLVAIFLLSQLPSRYLREKINFTTRSSSLVRTQIWRTALEIGKTHPVLGTGPGTFEIEYRKVAPTIYHPPLEWLVAKPHSLYLNLWVETGLLGLIGTVGASIVFLRRVLRANREASIYGAAFVAILGHGLLDTTMFKNDLVVLTVVVVVLGLSAMVVPRTEPENN
ncbi:MAG: O-antigen ligase family protein [Candidatus Kerfeldbacteria bacterium]|nr:O-antigen ligase family protein [Candidatus Kerfeldbacteria bacterium]